MHVQMRTHALQVIPPDSVSKMGARLQKNFNSIAHASIHNLKNSVWHAAVADGQENGNGTEAKALPGAAAASGGGWVHSPGSSAERPTQASSSGNAAAGRGRGGGGVEGAAGRGQGRRARVLLTVSTAASVSPCGAWASLIA